MGAGRRGWLEQRPANGRRKVERGTIDRHDELFAEAVRAGVRRIDVLIDEIRVVDSRLDAEQNVDLGAMERQVRLGNAAAERAPARAAVAERRHPPGCG